MAAQAGGRDARAGSQVDPSFERDAVAHPRRIRSFVTRAGRISPAQQRALDTMRPRWCLPYANAQLDTPTIFGRAAPLVLEIGFGMGAATVEIAAQCPEVDFIGVEVHVPGIGALLKSIGERGLSNLRVVEHDAVEVVKHMIAPASLSGAHVFFPDPWHKARHHKRRLIQPGFVALLASRLAPGAFLHCATDWEDYAGQMLAVLDAEPLLVNTSAGGFASPANPIATRPTTKFETRGLKLGHGVWDVIFSKR